jgi:hypothetical protein
MERCPYCSFSPTSLNDYCEEHRPRMNLKTIRLIFPDGEIRMFPDVQDIYYENGRGFLKVLAFRRLHKGYKCFSGSELKGLKIIVGRS